MRKQEKSHFYCKTLQTPTFTHKMQKTGNEIWGK